MIPKIIHYCWFGGNKKPDIVCKCIESWKKYCPDWEIREWNESNFDIECIPFMKEAYECKKWAFVSDVARLLIVYKYGGIYLDTDVELHASLDELLNVGAFYFFESIRNINTGLGFGAEKGHGSVKAMLNYYENIHFVSNGKMDLRPCPAINTNALKQRYHSLSQNGSRQLVEEILILSVSEYGTYAKHHGTASWVGDGVAKNQTGYRDTWLKCFLRDEKKFNYIEKHFGERAVQMYTFFSFDFLEYGISYYIKRKVLKRKKE